MKHVDYRKERTVKELCHCGWSNGFRKLLNPGLAGFPMAHRNDVVQLAMDDERWRLHLSQWRAYFVTVCFDFGTFVG